ncbi:phage baseplate assembly protein V [Dactylosporangium sp. NPDC049525]|uniref:phage baseplate assembly protein V n=1 Tax=Dactylosporangium sp. NPDC049525 TaxID=3154730 RepID=UPI003421518F
MIPAVDVTAAERALPDGCRVVGVRVTSRLSQPSQCELTLDDPQGRALDLLGEALVVQVAGDDGPLFTGEVTGVGLTRTADGTTETRVTGYDLLHRLRARQTVRSFEHLDAEDLAKAVAGDLPGVRVVGGGDGPRFERVVQHRQRDLQLLTDTLSRVGLFAVLDGADLRVLTLQGYGEPVALRYGRDLHHVEVAAGIDRLAARCEARGWHPQRAAAFTETAGQPRQGRDIKLRPDSPAPLTLVDESARTAEELRAVAQGALDASAARAVTLDGVAAGSAGLRAGRRITVRGVAPALDGTYVLTEVVSTVDADGYLAAVSTRPPAREVTRSATSLTLGRVTAVDDPDGCGRVRVALQAHGGLDAGWVSLLVPGAGDGKGLVLLPDVGDSVLVALPHDASGDAVVLGSLFGTTKAPDGAGVTGGGVKRWSMRTAHGQSIVVDDTERSLRVETADGSYLQLAPDVVRLHAATDLVLEAPGHGITVKARSVDFEHAIIAVPGGLT